MLEGFKQETKTYNTSERIKNLFEKIGKYTRRQALLISVSFASVLITGCAEDYTSRGTFNEAFSAARKDGKKEFAWNGNTYTTKLADKKLSDTYYDSFNFLERYYNSEYYKNKLSTSLDTLKVKQFIIDSIYDSMNEKYKELENIEDPNIWFEMYDQLQKENPEFKYLIEQKYDSLGYPGLNSKIDSIEDVRQKKVLENLHEPIYTSLTEQKGKLREDGFYLNDKGHKKVYIYGIGDRNSMTNSAHELTHKSTNGNVDLANIIEINNELVDNANSRLTIILEKFDYDIEHIKYLLNPTEIDARQNSTRYWLSKNFQGYDPTDLFTEKHYQFLMDNLEGLPYDIVQLIDVVSNKDLFIKNMNRF